MSALLPELAATLRAMGGADRLRVLKALPGLLGGLASLGDARRLGPEDQALMADCALRLLVLARTLRETSLVQRTLHTLFGMGRFGRALASLFVQGRTLPLAQIGPVLTTLPQRDFLAALNELLQDCPAQDRQYAAWLKSLLPAPGKAEVREQLQFLKALAESGAQLAPPLREAILAGPLPDAISRTLASATPGAAPDPEKNGEEAQGAGQPGPATIEALLTACAMLDTPALAERAWTYALRAAGGPGPGRLRPLLAAPHDMEDRDTALVLEMRRLADQDTPGALLRAAARCEPETLGLVLADMLAAGHSSATQAAPQAARLLPLLPLRGEQTCREALFGQAEQARQALMEAQFIALTRRDPNFLRRFVKSRPAMPPAPVLEALKHCLTLLPEPQPPEPQAPQPLPEPTGAPWMNHPQPRQGLAELLREPGQLRDLNLSGQSVSGPQLPEGALDGRTLSGVDLSRGRFERLSIARARLTGCSFSGALLGDCAFRGVTFSACDFSAARLSGCLFENCAFEGCDMQGLALHKCGLNGCSFSECSLLGACFEESRIAHTSARTTVFSGLRMRTSAVLGGEFTRCDFSGGHFLRTAFRNPMFEASAFTASALVGCELTGSRTARCDLLGLRMQGGHADDPHAHAASREAELAALPRQAQTLAPGLRQALFQGPGAEFTQACVEAFLRVEEVRETLAAMRAQDRRRRALALERLGEQQGQFLRLLPLILATDVFDKALGLAGVPHCCVADRALERGPTPADVELLAKVFPRHSPTHRPPAQLGISAVYAIGSLGTLAQKESSDIDCWVCCAPPERPEGQDAVDREALAGLMEGLKRKLAALETWAMQQYGLEVHFFAMTIDEVRSNAFGMSDKESSGSAQALLLKEEFYRTALKLCGRDLAWWAAPPGAGDGEVRALLSELAVLDPRLHAELIDLGQPAPIPPGEYFGACLWQMVKALHSPYKSVMKLGLLEKYAGQGKGMRLLCERIKEAALRGRSRLEDLDPYLALFSSISQHYERLGDSMGLGLIAECLLLKAEVAPSDLPPQLVRHCASGCGDAGGFASSMRLGGMVGRFMIEAYRRIQEGLKTGAPESRASITPQDLTRLGRRIAVNFAPSEHKVGLVPFLSEGLAFTELFFYAEKAPGKRTIWAVKGKEKNTGKAAVESLAPIRRDTDVARLVAWLMINGIYDPSLAVQAEKSFAPIAVMDLQALLADMAAFFPRRETLDPDMDNYLEAECVTKAYFILNLPIAPDKNKILHCAVLYATSWGELCCQSFENPPPTLQKSPLGFLRENLAKPVAGDVECRVFAPKKSACPRIKIL